MEKYGYCYFVQSDTESYPSTKCGLAMVNGTLLYGGASSGLLVE